MEKKLFARCDGSDAKLHAAVPKRQPFMKRVVTSGHARPALDANILRAPNRESNSMSRVCS